MHNINVYLDVQVWHIGRCPRCQDEIESHKITTNDLFLMWVLRLAKWIKAKYPHLTLIMWDDMMRQIPLEKLLSMLYERNVFISMHGK